MVVNLPRWLKTHLFFRAAGESHPAYACGAGSDYEWREPVGAGAEARLPACDLTRRGRPVPPTIPVPGAAEGQVLR